MNNILLFKSIFFEKIWGSPYLKKIGYTDMDKCGEMWSLSALESKETYCINDKYKGRSLSDLFENEKDLFRCKYKEFPLLIKLLTTSDDLSIQVHPDDEYALKNENCLGKNEGWFILDKKINSKIILSHYYESKEELVNLKLSNKKNFKFRTVSPKKYHFYPVPAKTLHALGKNIVLLEIQQSSDITYRIYDYDRLDKDGNFRELHINKALDVLSFEPYKNKTTSLNNKVLWDNKYFKVECLKVKNGYHFNSNNDFYVVTVAKGNFKYNDINLKIGETFIVPCDCKDTIEGKGVLLITTTK